MFTIAPPINISITFNNGVFCEMPNVVDWQDIKPNYLKMYFLNGSQAIINMQHVIYISAAHVEEEQHE